MSSVRKSWFILLFSLASCATPQVVVQDYQRDSVVTIIKEEIVLKDSIVYVPIPQGEGSAILPDTDTSHLETMVAVSEAYVHDNRLYHTLRNKDMLLPVEVQLPKYIYTKNDNIIRENRVVETIEVEKQLSRWQRFIQALGYGLLIACVIWLAVKFTFR